MSTLLADPLVHEDEQVASPSIPEFEAKTAVRLPVSEVQPKEETHPLWIVFVSCVIGFHVAAAMIGTLAAWVYQLRYSGAFAP